MKGVSTRKVAEVLESLIDCNPSAQTVSLLTKELDEEVKRFHRRKLEDVYRVIIFDGIRVKVKRALRVMKFVVLCAYGIRWDGVKEMISFMVVDSESEENSMKMINNLYERGLEGEKLELIVTDGAPGLQRALDMVYPYTPRQRCWVHKLRNIASKVPKKLQEECLREVEKIYLAKNRKEAGRGVPGVGGGVV